jgi:hypothetical protein
MQFPNYRVLRHYISYNYVLLVVLLFASAILFTPAQNVSAATIGPGHDVTFLGVQYDTPITGQSTWFYSVTSAASGNEISHSTFLLSLCMQIEGAGTWAGPSGFDSRNPGGGKPVPGTFPSAPLLDPSSGLTGLKFDDEVSSGTTRYYYFTVNGNYAPDDMIVGIKPGPNTFTGTVTGPSQDCALDYHCSLPASIGNFVWLDENSNGLQDIGEPGIPNVQVNLYDANGAEVATTRTDSAGGYLFANLAPGAYYVDVLDGTDNQLSTLPFAGMTQTTTYTNENADFGNQNHSLTLIPGGNGFTGYPVTVLSGKQNLTADFGYNYNPTACVTGTCDDPTVAIGDRVWADANGDGFQDVGEPGISGVKLTLYYDANLNGVYGTPYTVGGYTPYQTTNGAGNYLFDGLPPGAYVVRVDASNFAAGGALEGYTQTGDPDDYGQFATNPDNQTTAPLIMAPGDVFLLADFGYRPPASQNNSIGDKVWFDLNANGEGPDGNGANLGQDDNEKGIPGVTVALIKDLNNDGVWDAGEPIIATDITDANGDYLFTGLPDGSYLVWVNDSNNVLRGKVPTYDHNGGDAPAGSGAPIGVHSDTLLTISSVLNLGVDNDNPASDLTQDFGYTAACHTSTSGLIGDRVWLDIDSNGVQDPNEPGLGGLTVTLRDGNNNLLATRVTDNNGNYYFGGLPAGTFIVEVTPPAGMTQTYDADDGVYDGINPFNSPHRSTVTITTGEINLLQDFGYVGPGRIGNQVWYDSNADGLYDHGEEGLADVTIVLYWDLDCSEMVDADDRLISSTKTNGFGQYLFDGLSINDGSGEACYVVVVTDDNKILNDLTQPLGPDPGEDNNSQTKPYAVTLEPAVQQQAARQMTNSEENLTADFGFVLSAGSAAIGNRVWLDDGNGIQDPGELGLPGATVTLVIQYDGGSTTTLVTTTDQDGFYYFGNLLLSQNHTNSTTDTPTANEPVYTLSVTPPGNFAPTALGNGSFKTDSDDPAGVDALVEKGQTDVSMDSNPDNEAPNASYDFGFIAPTSVDLADTLLIARPTSVLVQWETFDEGNISSFVLYRVEQRQRIQLTEVFADSFGMFGGSFYTYEDTGLKMGTWYEYQLDIIRPNGAIQTVDLGRVFTGSLRIFLPALAR